MNKKSPFGNVIQTKAKHLPRYEMSLNFGTNGVDVAVKLRNVADLQESCTIGETSLMFLLVGDSRDNVLLYEKYRLYTPSKL